MIKIKITYNGQAFEDLDSAFMTATAEMFLEKVRSVVTPFEEEIASQGGRVSVISEDGTLETLQVKVENISEDLKMRITKALDEQPKINGAH